MQNSRLRTNETIRSRQLDIVNGQADIMRLGEQGRAIAQENAILAETLRTDTHATEQNAISIRQLRDEIEQRGIVRQRMKTELRRKETQHEADQANHGTLI